MRGRRDVRRRTHGGRGRFVVVLSLVLAAGAGTAALQTEVVDASFTSTVSTDASLTAGALTGTSAPAAGAASFTATPTLGGCSLAWSALAGGTTTADRLEVTEDTRSVTTTAAGDVGAGATPDVPDARGVLYRLRSRTGPVWVSPDAENRFALCQPIGVGGLGPGRFLGCALDTAGGWWCWGNVPQNTVSPAPVKVGGSSTYRQVGSFGETVLCAIRTDSTLWCFGTGTSGQLGQGTTASSATPVQVTASTSWRQLANGSNHVCATRTDDTLWCWGQNTYGQVGDGSTTNRTSPVQIGSAVWQRAWAADRTTCALRTDGTAWCWGTNTAGQIGTGTAGGSVTSPSQVGTATDWIQIAPSRTHVCGLRSGGTLWCWGANNTGQIGDGTTTDRLVPVNIDPGSVWTQVATYVDGSCAMRSDGRIWCWGNDAGVAPGRWASTS